MNIVHRERVNPEMAIILPFRDERIVGFTDANATAYDLTHDGAYFALDAIDGDAELTRLWSSLPREDQRSISSKKTGGLKNINFRGIPDTVRAVLSEHRFCREALCLMDYVTKLYFCRRDWFCSEDVGGYEKWRQECYDDSIALVDTPELDEVTIIYNALRVIQGGR